MQRRDRHDDDPVVDEPRRRFGLPGGARPSDVAQPSDIVLGGLHIASLDAERGAPGIGFGE